MAMMVLLPSRGRGKYRPVSVHMSTPAAHCLLSMSLLLVIFTRSCSTATALIRNSTAVTPVGKMDNSSDGCLKKIGDVSQLRCTLKLFDADFFPVSKVQDIVEDAIEFNIPVIRSNRKSVASIDGGLQNPSPLVFNPKWDAVTDKVNQNSRRFDYLTPSGVQRPRSDEDIAFMSVAELGELIRTRQVTSEELMRIFMQRLKRYGDILSAVVSFTEELAFLQAKEADRLLAEGIYLGPLHGIPYGLKDIIAVPHYRTTWGSRTFKNQILDIEAWVYKRLKSAGAVLVAKLVTGSLAYDDIWFGGRTRNPWNIEEFSTGSSAGPAACTSAG
ncbi:hypothetical protein SAY86_028026 [Trapa natans]|uniref:Amidase domain-containing protein n=1 Tax=Trapa natans TaxID=22666 RepID=A0AAN7MEW1_TRANT|nr:hypothetical protein SAY86_028026 [Trapa natans]